MGISGRGGDDDEGEHTRFPCLATVRSVVASVVTVLAIAVVVLVILAVRRPEDIILSIPRGYIQAEPLWYEYDDAEPAGRPGIGNNRRPVRALDMPKPADSSYSYYYKYKPAKPPVTLQLSWTAYNPSGRGKADCNVTAIRVLVVPPGAADQAGGAATEMGGAGSVSPDKPLRFSVPPKASHTEMQRLTVGDKGALQRLADWYGGKSSFMAMVQVNVTVASQVQLPSSSSSKGLRNALRYDCGPVAVVHGAPGYTTYPGITCITALPAYL